MNKTNKLSYIINKDIIKYAVYKNWKSNLIFSSIGLIIATIVLINNPIKYEKNSTIKIGKVVTPGQNTSGDPIEKLSELSAKVHSASIFDNNLLKSCEYLYKQDYANIRRLLKLEKLKDTEGSFILKVGGTDKEKVNECSIALENYIVRRGSETYEKMNEKFNEDNINNINKIKNRINENKIFLKKLIKNNNEYTDVHFKLIIDNRNLEDQLSSFINHGQRKYFNAEIISRSDLIQDGGKLRNIRLLVMGIIIGFIFSLLINKLKLK